jgi:hypothetical protein
MMLKDIDAGHKRDPHRTHSCGLRRWLRLRPHKHQFGITRIAVVTGLDRIGIPVALATRPNSRSVAVSQGKGLTLAAAKVSALMEAIELWHAEHIVRPMVFAAHCDLPEQPCGDRCRAPAAGRRQPVFAASAHALDRGPRPDERPQARWCHMNWCTPTTPIRAARPRLLCLQHQRPGVGRHLLEAICYGICEVIERDAISIWHQRDRRISCPQPDRSVDHRWRGRPHAVGGTRAAPASMWRCGMPRRMSASRRFTA